MAVAAVPSRRCRVIDFPELRMYAETDPAMFDSDVLLALLDVVEAAHGPIGQWSREGENANKRLNSALDRFDFGDAA